MQWTARSPAPGAVCAEGRSTERLPQSGDSCVGVCSTGSAAAGAPAPATWHGGGHCRRQASWLLHSHLAQAGLASPAAHPAAAALSCQHLLQPRHHRPVRSPCTVPADLQSWLC